MPTVPRKANIAFNVVNVLIPFLLSGLFVWIWDLGPEARDPWIREHGVVEMGTVIGYGIFLLLYAYFIRLKGTLAAPILASLMMFRELDFHSAFTTMSITKSRFFLSGEVPLYEKLIAGLVWILVIYCVIRVGLYFFKPALNALKRGRAYAWAGVACAVNAALGKAMDGLGRKLASIGIEIGDAHNKYWGAYEEVIEMGIPIYMCLAVVAYVVLSKQAAAEAAE
ncbi:MAG: hypothetical protein ACPGKS_04685 [Coraliomargarita sp.]